MANPRSPFLGKGSMHPFVHLSIGFWLYTALQCRSSMSSNCLVFHTSGGISSSPAAFLFLIFLRTESSSSCVNGPSLMSNCLLIILVIGPGVIFGGFPSKFSKCCFHSFILSCWFAALSFALAVFASHHTWSEGVASSFDLNPLGYYAGHRRMRPISSLRYKEPIEVHQRWRNRQKRWESYDTSRLMAVLSKNIFLLF